MSSKKQLADVARGVKGWERVAARRKLAALREAVAAAKRRRKRALRDAVLRCRAERLRVRERAKELRARARLELREAARSERLAAREACSLSKHRVRTTAHTKIEKRRGELQAERAYQRQMRELDASNRKTMSKLSSARERRDESDDEVRGNIPADLVGAFDRVKRQIRGSDKWSRTEEFLHWAEQHAGEVLASQNDAADREVTRLVREYEAQARAMHKAKPRGSRYTKEELAAVPF